jgi:protein-disulfide isomerase
MSGDQSTLAKVYQTLDKLALDEGARQKLNAADLAACVQKQDETKLAASIKEAEASPLNVGQTPVLFINGEKIEGVIPLDLLYRIIDGALIAEGQTPPPAPPASVPAPPPAAPPATKPGN